MEGALGVSNLESCFVEKEEEEIVWKSKETTAESSPSVVVMNKFDATRDWSPEDDGIIRSGQPADNFMRELVDTYISHVLYGPSTKKRLPAFPHMPANLNK